jgi:subtilisin family serine protease
MRKLLSLLAIVSLLLGSMPAFVIAQSQPDGDDGAGNRALLPFIQNGAATEETTDEEEIDSGLQSAGVGREMLIASQRVAFEQRALPANLADLKLESPSVLQNADFAATLAQSLVGASGRQQVVVRLREPSVVQQALTNAAASSAAAQQAQLAVVQQQQASVVAAALQLDASANVLGQVQKALNAVMVEIDAGALSTLAANPAVQSIRPVVNYSLALTETVPYIGGTAVQAMGYDGEGVSVAVLDSGIDYTHANLGGPGTLAAYEAAYGTAITDTRNTTRDGLFPTAKVVEGFDFVGEVWPDGDLAPDPDPIDLEGHGTHVADIIAGGRGVAPAADLHAVKVCSAVASSCSGVALLQAMDYALDPDGDGSMSDAVDIINMSLGSDYGSAADDDLSLAVEFASAYGIIVVASAGNGSDKPYVHGTPASAPSAIAVAQTNVPSAIQPVMEVTAPAAIAGQYEAVFQPWSVEPTVVIEGPVQYADGAGGNLNGCAPYTTALTGKIVLVDRGGCNFSLKISNISQAGGLAGIIGLIAPGDPFSGGDGGDRPIDIPGYMISQGVANRIKSGLAAGVTVKFDPAAGVPLVMHMVGSSSRGPSVVQNLVKPDIGAPGASISAIAGSGAGEGAFGGTSGAAPMVSGAAALLRQAFPTRSVAEIKALLMNTAETNILNRPAIFGGGLAPITRIGGGEVRVDRAVKSGAAAWDMDAQTGSLSFTFHDVLDEVTLKRLVNVRNYSDQNITYRIRPTFRFADDAATDAVDIEAPSSLFVPARGDAQFEVKVEVSGKRLRPWSMNSGARGANPAVLTLHEYDGYVDLVDSKNANNNIHLAWQILPRAAGDVSITPQKKDIRLRNRGVTTTTVESYSLIGVSSNLPQGGPGDNEPIPDLRYLGYSTYAVPAGFCNDTTASFVLAFAGNTWERQTHAIAPASYFIELDTNQDGEADYVVLTRDVSLNNVTDGRNLTWVVNLATDEADAFFFTDHETNSANTVMLLCAEQIGMTLADQLKPINVTAYLDDFYFGGRGDVISGITISPFGEQYLAQFEKGGIGGTTLARDKKDKMWILDFGPATNNTESGLLLLFRGGAQLNREAGTVVILP